MAFRRKRPELKVPERKVTLRDFFVRRNRVLVSQPQGGLGDTLMQRMVLTGVRREFPEAEITFAGPGHLLDAVADHPDVARCVPAAEADPADFSAYYNTCVTHADRHEYTYAPCGLHRADIWAGLCGFGLERHDMKFRLDPARVEACGRRLRVDGRPVLLLCPESKMSTKSLLPAHVEAVLGAASGCRVVGLHSGELPELTRLGVPGVYDSTLRDWMCYVAAADYVVSVDSAAFHMAGGLGKPLTGVFTFADGKVYGKHFDFVLVQKHRDGGDWACGPCYRFADCPKCPGPLKPCLTELGPAEVRGGVAEMLSRWPPGNRRVPLV